MTDAETRYAQIEKELLAITPTHQGAEIRPQGLLHAWQTHVHRRYVVESGRSRGRHECRTRRRHQSLCRHSDAEYSRHIAKT